MVRTSILEKLEILKNVILEDSFLLVIFGFFLLLGILLYGFSSINKKKYIKGFITIYLILGLVLVIVYNIDLYKVFDYLVNNVFYALLFPNIAIYFLMIIISNIILIKGLYNDMLSKLEKIVYVIFYTILMYFLYIVLRIITDNDIDVYKPSSVYLNNDLTAVLQVNMIIFILWVVFIIINKIFNIKINKEVSKENVKEDKKIIKIIKKLKKSNKKDEIIDSDVIINEDNNENKEDKVIYENIDNIDNVDNIDKEEYIIPKFTKEEYLLLSKILKEEITKRNDNED